VAETESGQSKTWQIIATVVTVATLAVVFGGILPQLADCGEAWDAVQGMPSWTLGLLVLVTVANIIVYVWPYQAALPGIAYWPAFAVRNTSFAVDPLREGGFRSRPHCLPEPTQVTDSPLWLAVALVGPELTPAAAGVRVRSFHGVSRRVS
jgi:hypothetical protein